MLEQVPQKINQRPLAYVGRDDLESLMASTNCKDWIKIRFVREEVLMIMSNVCIFHVCVCGVCCSEMLLGPVPDNFSFLPKHKANAYS